jgi:PAS domain S-box-containing protein
MVPAAAAIPQSAATLTDAASVNRLSASAVASGSAVRIDATVLYSDPDWSTLFVGDDSGVVFVDPLGLAELPRVGARVRLLGRVGWVRAGPAVVDPHLTPLGDTVLPAAAAVVGPPSTGPHNEPRWTTLEAVVRRVARGANRTTLRLSVAGQAVEAHIPEPATARVLSLVDAAVRARGVLERCAGPPHSLQLWVPGWAELVMLRPAFDPQSLRVSFITDIRSLASQGTEHRVRVQGRIARPASQRSFVIEDTTGGIEVEFRDPYQAREGARIDVWGFPAAGPGGPSLVDTSLRVIENPATTVAPQRDPSLSVIQSAAALRALPRDEAQRGHPVSFDGILTYSDRRLIGGFFVEGAGEAVFVFDPSGNADLAPGSRVKLRGFSGPGSLAPIVVEPRVQVLGQAPLPRARPVGAAQLRSGEEDCQRVETSGVVRLAEKEEDRVGLVVFSEGVRFEAALPRGFGILAPEALVDARVRLRGICQTLFNWRGQLQNVRLCVSRAEDLEIESPPGLAPFSLPVVRLADVLRMGDGQRWGHRVRVAGVVVHQDPGRDLFLRDTTGTIRVQAASALPLVPGDRVEATGFPVAGANAPILEDAVYRLVGRGPAPMSVAVTPGELLAGAHDIDLVTIRATVLQLVHSPARSVVLLQSGAVLTSATLEGTLLAERTITTGSTVDVTAVAILHREPGVTNAVRLVLRGPDDLRVVATPPWWTPARARAALLVLSAVLSIAFAWVITLRRQVRRQTAAVREHAERVVAGATELAAEKERLAVTLGSIGDGVIATDVAGCVVLMNRVAERLTGWSLAEAQGRPLREVLPLVDGESRQPQADPLTAVLAGADVRVLPAQSLLVRRDKREILIADSVAPIRDRESRTVGAVLAFRDVTERRKVEEQLQNAQKLEALGILAGGLAHDFNNLLTGIFGYVDLAHKRCTDDPKAFENLGKALSVLDKARGLAGQLLTFSRAGQPVTMPLALGELLRKSVDFGLSGSNVVCEMRIPEDLWPCRGDRRQIDQLVDNLLLNARQAMPMGGTITLVAENVIVPEDTRAAMRAGRYVRITVRDQGVGIPPELRARIFEPFFTTKTQGSGLGLTTSYSIVRKHNGYIDVESEPGVGTCFVVHLPASDEPVRYESPATSEPILGQGRLLVMDDEEYVRDVARQMLQELGYSVVVVRDGDEAVRAYERARDLSQPFDLVILDLTIPGGRGGSVVLARLRSIDPQVRALASSGYSGDPIMADPVSHGFVGRLTKPYTEVELGAAIAHVPGRERA